MSAARADVAETELAPWSSATTPPTTPTCQATAAPAGGSLALVVRCRLAREANAAMQHAAADDRLRHRFGIAARGS